VARVDRVSEVDDGSLAFVVIVVAEARREEPPPLLYAALRGSCPPGLASSSLRPTSRKRPTIALTGQSVASPYGAVTAHVPSDPDGTVVI
jgi:hypothetical protein